jgi:Na+-translocating ferredoxin:NAD+ oxidoreductase RnfC subunit
MERLYHARQLQDDVQHEQLDCFHAGCCKLVCNMNNSIASTQDGAK